VKGSLKERLCQSPAYPSHLALAFHVLFQIRAYSVCPPVPGQGYVYSLETVIGWFGIIVPLCVPKILGYGLVDGPVSKIGVPIVKGISALVNIFVALETVPQFIP